MEEIKYGTFISDDGHIIHLGDVYYRVSAYDTNGPQEWRYTGHPILKDLVNIKRYKFKSSALLDFCLNMKQYKSKEDFAEDMKKVKELIENEIKKENNGKESRI